MFHVRHMFCIPAIRLSVKAIAHKGSQVTIRAVTDITHIITERKPTIIPTISLKVLLAIFNLQKIRGNNINDDRDT